jgi:hypothetical protein
MRKAALKTTLEKFLFSTKVILNVDESESLSPSPGTMSAAAPEGTPPRRIRGQYHHEKSTQQKLPAPPCPGGAFMAGNPLTV